MDNPVIRCGESVLYLNNSASTTINNASLADISRGSAHSNVKHLFAREEKSERTLEIGIRPDVNTPLLPSWFDAVELRGLSGVY